MSALTAAHCVDLQALHSFGLPAFARELRPLATHDDLHAYAHAWRNGEPSILLGEGSNSVFINAALDATVWRLSMTGKQYLGCDGVFHYLRVCAGENWHQLVEWTVSKGWFGLENLALIPGSVGAGPVQNIGAYGVELKDRISAVHVFDAETEVERVFSREECAFSYRDSMFKHSAKGRYVITSLDFALPVKWQPVLGYGDVAHFVGQLGAITPMNVMKAVCAIRADKLPDPVTLGNSGSFFKNPIVLQAQADTLLEKFPGLVHYPAGKGLIKLAAGWLIDQAGLRGFVCGGVGVFSKQALILVNLGNGQSSDLLLLIKHIQERVQNKFGVLLEPEPNLIA